MSAETLWLPRSTCGPQCLPPAAAVPAVGAVEAAGRLLAAFAVVFAAALLLPVATLVRPHRRAWMGRIFGRALLAALDVSHAATGRPPGGGALLVSNHVSWLDVLVFMAYAPARLVAKHDVRGWPVIGWLAAAAGTVFIDRSKPRALPGTVARVAAQLRAGAVVAVFPEGTTWCGRNSGEFRPALFQAALDAGAPVIPVTLRFVLADGCATTVAAYIGGDTLLASIWRVVRTRGLRVTLRFRPALHPIAGGSRRTLARAAQWAHGDSQQVSR